MISHKYFINAFLCYSVTEATSSSNPNQDLICCFSVPERALARVFVQYKNTKKHPEEILFITLLFYSAENLGRVNNW